MKAANTVRRPAPRIRGEGGARCPRIHGEGTRRRKTCPRIRGPGGGEEAVPVARAPVIVATPGPGDETDLGIDEGWASHVRYGWPCIPHAIPIGLGRLSTALAQV